MNLRGLVTLVEGWTEQAVHPLCGGVPMLEGRSMALRVSIGRNPGFVPGVSPVTWSFLTTHGGGKREALIPGGPILLKHSTELWLQRDQQPIPSLLSVG
jgi:hypothetical protein